ncbi:MAG: hypothetical protein IKE43_11910 [Coriobacteriales bacterium]|nr:hypothetical protein [Coriobacteriales bacterium]
MGQKAGARLDFDTILESLTAYDFVFRAVDDDGLMCTYDALFACKDPLDGSEYLVYADAEPAENDDCATYASVLTEPEAAEEAQQIADSGKVLKEYPVLELIPIESPEGNEFVRRVFTALELDESN